MKSDRFAKPCQGLTLGWKVRVASERRWLGFFAACLCFALTVTAASTTPQADRLWQTVLEQATGPGNQFTSQAEAVKAMRTHLDKQEAALRDFQRSFPTDPRHYSAAIRLSGVLAAKSRLLTQPDLRDEARKILVDMADAPDTPDAVKADAGFALVSQAMEDAGGQPSDRTRDALMEAIRSFERTYPADRRTAGLLTEIATLYDSDPGRKAALLDEALTRTKDESLRARINDDRKRLALLGKPLDLELTPWQGGAPIHVAALRGHAVVILFWASWSAPSLRTLEQLEQMAGRFSGQPVDYLTVSLDKDPKALAATCQAAKLRWPVSCDGRGWEGDTVRTLGINALPTVWVLDRQSNLLTLNAHGAEAAGWIQKALAAP